jgi:hypothetical protein
MLLLWRNSLFYPEDGGSRFLQNDGNYHTDYTSHLDIREL